jgi:ADP-ribose pyrophosphatase
VEPDSSETIWQGKLLGITVEHWGPRVREIVEHPGAVTIVSVDTERQMAFVRQLREATRRSLLELPAGTREPDEDPLVTAQRELQEECGLTGGTWSRLGGYWTAPGFAREYMDVYLAEGVERGDASPEDDEELEVVLVPAAEVADLLPQVEDMKTLAGLLLYLRL